MIFVYCPSAKHLQINNVGREQYKLKQFCDGEIFVKIDDDLSNKEVCLVTSTQPPEKNIIETVLLLDALQNVGAQINLFFTYFGYARQDRINEPGEALSARVICNFYKQFSIKKIYIFQPHSDLLQQFLKFESIFPGNLYTNLIKEIDVDCVVAPDKGAKNLCQKIAQTLAKEFAWIEKFRPEQERVQMQKLNGDVSGKSVVIIDDMISTGNTTIKAADFLLENGAKAVRVIATHGIFCPGAIEKIQNSKISEVYITNSLKQNISSNKIKIIDISEFIVNSLS